MPLNTIENSIRPDAFAGPIGAPEFGEDRSCPERKGRIPTLTERRADA